MTDPEIFEPLIRQFSSTLSEQLGTRASRYTSSIALIDKDEILLYQAFNERVDRLAAGLFTLGLHSGERVIVQLPKVALLSHCFCIVTY